MLTEKIKPHMAAARLAWRRWSADRLAGRQSPFDDAPWDPPAGFMFGCGLSGVSALAPILQSHPEACCLDDPSHYWAAIDRRTDVTNLYEEVEGRLLMDARHASARAKVRFNRLVHRAQALARKPVVVEASAHNVCRIGFLDALAPGARFLNLVRDGLDVAQSINAAAAPAIRIAGRPDYNPWWGAADSKWAALARDGAAAGYFAEEVGPLETGIQRGAYEWLVSLAEADRWRHRLGARMAEISYAALAGKPREAVATVCAHFGLAPDPAWVSGAAAMLPRELPAPAEPLRLPPRMAAAFNAQQERFGFLGRAGSL